VILNTLKEKIWRSFKGFWSVDRIAWN
jgi:hypothetical protein